MDIGYVRVSTKDQNTTRQLEKMHDLGIQERFIFIDKESGKDFNRESYQAMRLALREGDCLYLDSLDRLGRDYDGIIAEWKYITKELKCDIICLDMEDMFNTKRFKEMGDVGKLLEDYLLNLFSYIAMIERKKNRERQREGIEIAKAEGKYKGRAKLDTKNFEKYAVMWANGEMRLKDAVKKSGMSEPTFFRKCKEFGIKKVS